MRRFPRREQRFASTSASSTSTCSMPPPVIGSGGECQRGPAAGTCSDRPAGAGRGPRAGPGGSAPPAPAPGRPAGRPPPRPAGPPEAEGHPGLPDRVRLTGGHLGGGGLGHLLHPAQSPGGPVHLLAGPTEPALRPRQSHLGARGRLRGDRLAEHRPVLHPHVGRAPGRPRRVARGLRDRRGQGMGPPPPRGRPAALPDDLLRRGGGDHPVVAVVRPDRPVDPGWSAPADEPARVQHLRPGLQPEQRGSGRGHGDRPVLHHPGAGAHPDPPARTAGDLWELTCRSRRWRRGSPRPCSSLPASWSWRYSSGSPAVTARRAAPAGHQGQPLPPARRPRRHRPLPDLHHRGQLAAGPRPDRSTAAAALPDPPGVVDLCDGVDQRASRALPHEQLHRHRGDRGRDAGHVDRGGLRLRVLGVPLQTHHLRGLPGHHDGADRGHLLHQPPDGGEPRVVQLVPGAHRPVPRHRVRGVPHAPGVPRAPRRAAGRRQDRRSRAPPVHDPYRRAPGQAGDRRARPVRVLLCLQPVPVAPDRHQERPVPHCPDRAQIPEHPADQQHQRHLRRHRPGLHPPVRAAARLPEAARPGIDRRSRKGMTRTRKSNVPILPRKRIRHALPTTLIAGALLAAGLAGCSASTSSSTAQQSSGIVNPAACGLSALASAAKPVQIVMWHELVRTNNDWLVNATNAFNSSQSQVHVSLVQQPDYKTLFEKYKAGLSTGDLPDVAQFEDTTVQQLVDSQSTVPVQDCIDASHYSLSDYLPRTLKFYNVQNVQRSMPWAVSDVIMYYDPGKFAKAGLDPNNPPQTLAQVMQDSQKIVASGAATHGIALHAQPYVFEYLLAKSGGEYVNNGNGRTSRTTDANLTSPTATKIWNWWDQMVKSGLALNTGSDPNSIDHLLAIGTGNAAMTFEASGVVGPIEAVLSSGQYKGTQIAAAPLPALTTGGGVPVGDGSLWIGNHSSLAKRAAAWKFIQYLDLSPY